MALQPTTMPGTAWQVLRESRRQQEEPEPPQLPARLRMGDHALTIPARVVLPRFSGQLSTAVESVCLLPPFSAGCQELPLLAAE
jgi:hypothetical protein